ncbi:hypothetical protein LINPERHAP2_LOCUS34839 [Linum perenne]
MKMRRSWPFIAPLATSKFSDLLTHVFLFFIV